MGIVYLWFIIILVLSFHQGLESYVTNTKDAPKKADQGKKLEVKVQPKHDTSGSNLIPSPPPKSKEEMALDQIEKEGMSSGSQFFFNSQH